MSSIWWGRDHQFNDRNQLALRYAANGKSSWKDDATYGELLIDLATGKPVAPKQRLLPEMLRAPVIRLLPVREPLPALTTDAARCADGEPDGFDTESRINLPSKQVFLAAKSPLPFAYPPLARTARIQGAVVADILLNAAGRVTCARIRSAQPLFRTAALDGLLAMQVDPAIVTGPSISTVTVEFSLARQ